MISVLMTFHIKKDNFIGCVVKIMKRFENFTSYKSKTKCEIWKGNQSAEERIFPNCENKNAIILTKEKVLNLNLLQSKTKHSIIWSFYYEVLTNNHQHLSHQVFFWKYAFFRQFFDDRTCFMLVWLAIQIFYLLS